MLAYGDGIMPIGDMTVGFRTDSDKPLAAICHIVVGVGDVTTSVYKLRDAVCRINATAVTYPVDETLDVIWNGAALCHTMVGGAVEMDPLLAVDIPAPGAIVEERESILKQPSNDSAVSATIVSR